MNRKDHESSIPRVSPVNCGWLLKQLYVNGPLKFYSANVHSFFVFWQMVVLGETFLRFHRFILISVYLQQKLDLCPFEMPARIEQRTTESELLLSKPWDLFTTFGCDANNPHLRTNSSVCSDFVWIEKAAFIESCSHWVNVLTNISAQKWYVYPSVVQV